MATPHGDWQPATPNANPEMGGRSSFGPATTKFDWDYGNPSREVRQGLHRLSGPIIVYSQADLEALFAAYRPINVQVCGDPNNGGTVFVDYFGADPTSNLVLNELRPKKVGDPAWYPNPRDTIVQYPAILSSFKRTRAVPGGVHFCEAEFTLTGDGVELD